MSVELIVIEKRRQKKCNSNCFVRKKFGSAIKCVFEKSVESPLKKSVCFVVVKICSSSCSSLEIMATELIEVSFAVEKE